MLRSMVVIVALVVIVFVAVPRPQGRIEQPVDVASAVAQAETSGIEVSAPEVPAGWEANVATFEADPVEGLPTLSLGWVVPGGTFVGVRATRGATPSWTSGVTDDGVADGVEGEPTVVLGGREWERLIGGDGRRPSLLLDGAGERADGPGGPVTYVVTGTAAEPDLERVAAQVVPG